MKFLHRIVLIFAAVQFAFTALPPGNADLISLQLQAFDLSHGTTEFLYPGKDFAGNEAWVAHHERSMRALGAQGEPNWCFYPPLLAFLLKPWATLHPEVWRLCWATLQCFAIFALALLTMKLLERANYSFDRFILFALFLSYPVARSVELGQTSIFIALLVWLSIWLLEQKPLWASLTLGLAAFVKPFALAAGLANKRNAVVMLGGSVIFAALLLLANLTAVGSAATGHYVDFLLTLGRSYTTYSGNQSLLAGLLRITGSGSVTDYGFGQADGISALAKIIAVMLLTMTVIAYTSSRERDPIATATLWLSAALLALPITWEHHFVLLLPGLAALWATAQDHRKRLLLAVITALIGINWTWLYSDQFSGRLAANLPLLGNLLLYFYLISDRFRYRTQPILAPTN